MSAEKMTEIRGPENFRVIEKHPLWLRIVHWLNPPLLCLMVWSGLLIYWANGVYPGFFPVSFYETFSLKQRLAEGMAVHFAIGWLFVINSTVYLVCVIVLKHYREIFPNRASMRVLIPTLLHDIGFKPRVALPRTKFNAVQRVAYTSAMLLGMLEILSGFAIYKPVQLYWLLALFGGYEGARLVHFIAMLSLCAFTLVHVIQVARAGWNNFRAMVAGFELEREES